MKLHCFVSVLSAFFFVNKTKWFSGLHLVVLFLFWLFCAQFLFFMPFKKTKRPDTHSKPPPPKKKMQQKMTKKKVPTIWKRLTQKSGMFLSSFSFVVLISISLQKEEDFWKTNEYGCVAICRRNFCQMFRFLPQCYGKKCPKRDVANLPRLCPVPGQSKSC